MKTEFEDGLVNFKILFLKAEFLTSMSQNILFSSLSYSTQWQFLEKRISKKNMFTTEDGNDISSCIIYFSNPRKYSKEILWKSTFKYFEKAADFPDFI